MTGCPDGGTCHHECPDRGSGRSCWRVLYCEPLSGVYPKDQWPPRTYRSHVAADQLDRAHPDHEEEEDAVAETPKRGRTRLLRAEIWMHLAIKAEIWMQEVQGRQEGILPYEEWPEDSPLRLLVSKYGLEKADLIRALQRVADQVETRAMRAGYMDHWDDDADGLHPHHWHDEEDDD